MKTKSCFQILIPALLKGGNSFTFVSSIKHFSDTLSKSSSLTCSVPVMFSPPKLSLHIWLMHMWLCTYGYCLKQWTLKLTFHWCIHQAKASILPNGRIVVGSPHQKAKGARSTTSGNQPQLLWL